MRIESEISSRVLRIKADAERIGYEGTEKVLRITALDAVAQIIHRIQQLGRGARGGLISGAVKKIGAYSARHGKARQAKGRQTGYIDLTFDGNLINNFNLIGSDGHQATIGFTDERQSEIAGYLEAYFGEIFALSEQEQDFAIQTFNEEIDKYINEIV